MKYFLILIVSFSFSLVAFAQDSLGFTNKAGAENKTVNGLKEGKWCENVSSYFLLMKDTSGMRLDSSYRLVVYKAGKPNGIARYYHGNGKLFMENTFTNGKEDGMQVTLFENGKTAMEIPYLDGKLNGVEKDYYESGSIKAEYHYSNDKAIGLNKGYYESGKLKWEATFVKGKETGIAKEYYESGNLKSETVYSKGVKGTTKNYDENGKEIK
jgi:antitoxin component YwqK of YwqJK toxin-antitoxin module